MTAAELKEAIGGVPDRSLRNWPADLTRSGDIETRAERKRRSIISPTRGSPHWELPQKSWRAGNSNRKEGVATLDGAARLRRGWRRLEHANRSDPCYRRERKMSRAS